MCVANTFCKAAYIMAPGSAYYIIKASTAAFNSVTSIPSHYYMYISGLCMTQSQCTCTRQLFAAL